MVEPFVAAFNVILFSTRAQDLYDIIAQSEPLHGRGPALYRYRQEAALQFMRRIDGRAESAGAPGPVHGPEVLA
jgi:hypothetical protein